jgi:6-phosphogluconolactonase (cycloisomerase 2 family)
VDGGTFGDQSSIATASHPLAIAIHPSGKFAYVANFSSNSISAYSVDATTGKLSSIDANDATTAIDTIPTRSGPVSIAIHPGGGYAYVANATSGDISVYSIDATSGALTAIDANGANAGTNTYISTMGNLPYSVAVDPTGQFLYAVNSNSGGVAHFDIASDGTLTYISCSLSCNANSNAMTGINPRSVAVDPTGQFLYVANNSDKTVWVYNINANGVLNHAGALTESPTTGHPIALSIDTTGQFLYVASSDTAGTIEPFSINTLSGKLTSAGPAVSSGTNTNSVTTSR